MKNNEIFIIPEETAHRQPVVYFDGECSLCSSTVQFLLKHNTKGNLSFSSLQSTSGKKIASLAGKKSDQPDTLFFLQDNNIYDYSTAAIKIAAHLRFPWNLAGIFYVIPANWRDLFYKYIAKNRYTWFGKEPFCLNSTKSYASRFFD